MVLVSTVRIVDPAGQLVTASRHAIVPGLGRSLSLLDHGDATGNRTHELAEVASDALGLVDPRNAIACELADRERARRLRGADRVGMRRARLVVGAGEDALVRAVVASRHAELTSDTELRIDLRDELVVQIEVTPLLVAGHRAAAELVHALHAVRVEVFGEAY